MSDHERNVAFSVFVIICLVAGLALVANMSKEDNDKEQKYYCQMVHEGVQPDYNGTYKQGKCLQSQGTAK